MERIVLSFYNIQDPTIGITSPNAEGVANQNQYPMSGLPEGSLLIWAEISREQTENGNLIRVAAARKR